MVDIACETTLPAEYIEVDAVWVRGMMGPMTVWTTPDSHAGKQEEGHLWKKIHEAEHAASLETYCELRLDAPLRLRPGERCGLYVHSALPGDEAVVYDNQRRAVTYEDRVFKVYPGFAHLSNRPFGKRGFWGRPWRSHREFVGRMSYGVRWKMWQPAAHLAFPLGFRTAVLTMIMASRRPESLMYLLQDEIVFFIMNKCSWDWWGTKMPDDDEAECEEEDPEAGSGSRSGAAVDGGMGTLYASLLGLGGSASNYAYYGGMFAEGSSNEDDEDDVEWIEESDDDADGDGTGEEEEEEAAQAVD